MTATMNLLGAEILIRVLDLLLMLGPEGNLVNLDS